MFYVEEFYVEVVRDGLNKSMPPLCLNDRFTLNAKAIALSNETFPDSYDRKLQQYIEADLINYNIRDFQEENNPKRYEEHKTPFAVLNIRDLEAGFVVCLVPLALTILVFAVEWMLTLKNLLLFILIFKTYFDVKQQEHFDHGELMKRKVAKKQRN